MTDLIKKIASWPLSLVAALAKALGNSYGVLLLYCFLMTGTLTIVASLLNPAIWLVLACSALSVFFVSSFMEGKALAKQIAKWLGADPEAIKKFFDLVKKRCPSAISSFLSKLGYILAPITYILGYVIPILAASAKGATMAAGTIGTLVLIFTTLGLVAGPTGWIVGIAILFGLGVFGASFCKEGVTFRRKFFQYCLPQENLFSSLFRFIDDYIKPPLQRRIKNIIAPIGDWQRDIPWINKPLKIITQFIASLFPLAAALGKALGNGFGLINFLNMYCDLPHIVGDVSPEPGVLIAYLLVLAIVGVAITVDSLSMEGYYLWHRLYKFINSFLGIKSPKEQLDFEFAFAANRVAQKIAANHSKDPNEFRNKPPSSLGFLSFVAWAPSVIAGTAKGCTMGSGMAGILMLVFGLPALTSPIGVGIGAISLFCGTTVALVSIFKEGRVLQRRLSKLLLQHVAHQSEPTYGAKYEKEFISTYTYMLNNSDEIILKNVDLNDYSEQYIADDKIGKKFVYTPKIKDDCDHFLNKPSTMNYGMAPRH